MAVSVNVSDKGGERRALREWGCKCEVPRGASRLQGWGSLQDVLVRVQGCVRVSSGV